jgi:hypothetical protein
MFTKDNERKSRKVKENHENEGIVGWRESLYLLFCGVKLLRLILRTLEEHLINLEGVGH